jgi:hypothetical protein
MERRLLFYIDSDLLFIVSAEEKVKVGFLMKGGYILCKVVHAGAQFVL